MSENPKNIVKVSFGGAREAYLEEEEGLVQYDYGQYLIFEDIELPDSYTVHFGNEKEDGLSKPMVGDANGVEIPPEYIETGLPVWAWVFLHETELDGETEYIVKIPVKRRSRPTNYAPTQIQQSAIDQAIAALNAGATRAAADAAAAEESKTAAKASEEAAKESETAAKESEDNAKDSETDAAAAAKTAESYARGGTGTRQGEDTDNAAYYAARAKNLVDGAVDTINTARDEAKTAVQNTGTAQKNLVTEEGAAQVRAVRQEGQTQAANAKAQADAAGRSAAAAKTSEDNAKDSETAAKASEDAAKESETAAKESKDNAKDSETAAAQSAEQAKHAAESVISLNFTDFDTGTTYGYGLGIKGGYPALKIYTNTEG